ncbi:MAG: mannose-1-phosphate guanylyltransferase [bacterium]
MIALIMAGGVGTRFWPKSREKHPKQLLKILGENTMIQCTVKRLLPLIPLDKIFVVTTEKQREEIIAQLPHLPAENFIIEPKGKNTAPCIGLGALFLERIDPDEVMVVMPADHLISGDEQFIKTLKVGDKIAREKDNLITIGIEPTYPATGYGYIQYHEQIDTINGVTLLKVKTFAEKPNLATAQRFMESGDFLWNSGIFIWKIKTILQELEEYLPHLYDGLLEIRKVLGTDKQDETIHRVYCQIKSNSIDYGVMEQAKDVVVLQGKFDWNDLGSWDEVYTILSQNGEDNILLGEHVILDGKGCYIDAPKRSVAVLGLDELIVVDTDDAILICPRNRAQDVKDLVDLIKRKKMHKLL